MRLSDESALQAFWQRTFSLVDAGPTAHRRVLAPAEITPSAAKASEDLMAV